MTVGAWRWVLSGWLLVVVTQAVSPPKPDMTYWISYLQNVRPGDNVDVKVWVGDASSPVQLSLDLLDYYGRPLQPPQNYTLAATDEIQTIQFKVAETFNSRYYYSGYLRARGSGGRTFDAFERMYIRGYDRLQVFIQTDKHTYMPGQRVRGRVLAMHSDMTVSQEPVTVTIYDPANNKIATYTNLTSKKNGVVEGEFRLSDDPPLGSYWMRATVDGVTASKRFKVLAFDEPQFDVRVRFDEGFGISTADKITAKIIARYQHGTPVQGSGKINVTLPYYRPTMASVVKQFELNDKGMAEVDFSVKELEDMAFNVTYGWLAERYPNIYTPSYLATRRRTYTLNYRRLNFKATVTDSVTEDVSARSKSLMFYNTPVRLRFIAPTPPSFKPDLPLNLYVEAVKPNFRERVANPESYSVKFDVYYWRAWDEKVDGEYSTIYSWQRPPRQKTLLMSKIVPVNSEGLAVWEIECLTFPEEATYIVVEAKTNDITTSKYLYEYTSPSDTYTQLKIKSGRGRVGKPITIVAESNKPFRSFVYQVMSKGKLLAVQKVTPTRESKKQEFTINVTQDMYPAADIVVFFEATNGEVVADRLVLPVDGQLPNELSLRFKKDQVKPGSVAKLRIGGKPGTIMFLLGVDKAMKMYGKGNDIRKEDILEELATLSGSSIYWRNDMIWYYYYARDTDDVFNSARVAFITDGVMPGSFYLDNIPYTLRNQFTTTLTPPTTRSTTTRITTTTTRPTTTTTLRAPSSASTTVAGPPVTTTTTMRPTTTTTASTTTSEIPQPEEPEGPDPFEPEEELMKMLPDTWLFDSVVIENDGQEVNLDVPENPNSYVISAFGVHPDDGLTSAPEPVELLATKPLYAMLEVPPRVYQGEDVCMTAVTTYIGSTPVEASISLTPNETAFDNIVIKRKGDKRKVIYKSLRFINQLGTLNMNDRKPSSFCVNPKVIGDVFPEVVLKKGKKTEDTQTGLMRVLPEGVSRSQGFPMLFEVERNKVAMTTVNLDLPADYTPGSLDIIFQISGNLLGIPAENLRNILRTPSATGDQNLVNFVPAVYVYKYMQATGGLTNRINRRTTMFLQTSLQTQYKSKRFDGSFSEFGASDEVGSVQVTAAFLKALAQAVELGDDVITVDQNVVNRAVYWLERQRNVDGSFKEPGRDAHPKLKSGSMELTAFVVIALQEVKNALGSTMSSFYLARLNEALRDAVAYLEKNLAGCSNDPYAASIVAYALAVTNSTKADDARMAMERLATVQGTMKFWSVPNVIKQTRYPWYRDTNPLSIEATSYALLTMLRSRSVSDVIPIFRWLNEQRGPYGGFITLHDTIVAFEALSKFSSVHPRSDSTPIEVEIMWTCGPGTDQTKKINITRNNLNDMLEVVLPVENGMYPTSVTVKVRSNGATRSFIYGQVFVQYNLKRETVKQSFVSTSKISKNSVRSFVITTCIRRTTNVKYSSIVLAKVAFPSAYDIDKEGSDFGAAGHVEFLERKAILYFASLGREDECFKLRFRMTKGSVANHKRVPIRVYDLFRPDDEYTTFYSIKRFKVCEVEPSYAGC